MMQAVGSAVEDSDSVAADSVAVAVAAMGSVTPNPSSRLFLGLKGKVVITYFGAHPSHFFVSLLRGK